MPSVATPEIHITATRASGGAQPTRSVSFAPSPSPPAAHAPEPPQLHVTAIGHVVTASDSFCASFSAALLHHASLLHARNELLPPGPSVHAADIRETVIRFIVSQSSYPVSLLNGLSPRQYIRTTYIANGGKYLGFTDGRDPRIPDSFREYTHLMGQHTCLPDRVFITMAAIAYKCQIVIIGADSEAVCVPPDDAIRRIHILMTRPPSDPDQRYAWAHLNAEACTDAITCKPQQPLHIVFDQPPELSPIYHGPTFGPVAPPASVDDSIPAPAQQMQWLQEAHCGYTGHPGIGATLKILRSNKRVWRGMTAHVAQFVKRCPTCMTARIHLNPARVSAATIRVDALPLRRWHIDMTGNLSTCLYTGFTRLMTFRDESTGFKLLFGSRFGCALEVAIAFLSVIGLFGLPDSFHTDGGPENDAYIWHQFTQMTGIKHTVSLPAQPHSNGIAEASIKSAKRFLRTLCVDLGRHNAWGLYTGMVQLALNSLPCSTRLCTSNQLVFASFYNPDHFVIPSTYNHQSPDEDQIDIDDANHYGIGANFVHRATYIQQLVTNHYHEHLDILLEQAIRRDPQACDDIAVGQHVLIEWPNAGPPSPQHPTLRGPYLVFAKSQNVLKLSHISIPPPADQPASIKWSKHARVYSLDVAEYGCMTRNPNDPAASQVPAGPPSLMIDCILDDEVFAEYRGPEPNHVANRSYYARLWGSHQQHGSLLLQQCYTYDQVKHSYAFDSYVACHIHLHGHTPMCAIPLGWDPHAVSKSLRPSHHPVLATEHGFPLPDDYEHSQSP